MKKHWGRLDAGLAHVQEVAVVQGLQAQVVELLVAAGIERGAQAGQVVLQQAGIEQFVVHALLDELREIGGIGRAHVGGHHVLAQHLAHDGVQQQAGGGVGVVGVLLDQRARGQDGGLVHLVHRDAVIQVAQRLGHDGRGVHVLAQVGAGGVDQAAQAGFVQRHALAVVDHVQHRRGGHGLAVVLLVRAFLGAALAVEHVGAGDFMVAAAHEAQAPRCPVRPRCGTCRRPDASA